ncbi:MAG: hypothetical protein JSS07_11360 [Proteobacteria bacterium]|nr:hypothetical protein [Pseudomonadota bacterium]
MRNFMEDNHDAITVTENIHPAFNAIAKDITGGQNDMGCHLSLFKMASSPLIRPFWVTGFSSTISCKLEG